METGIWKELDEPQTVKDNLLLNIKESALHCYLIGNQKCFKCVSIEGLSQKFECIPDIGNVARGTEPPPYNLEDMAADVVGILDALDIDQAHLFAISMGGMIGQVIAAKHGDRLKTFFSVMSSSSKPGLPGPTFPLVS